MTAEGVAFWLGWVGTALSAAFAIPQAIRLTRTASVEGVSLLPWQALLASNLAWTTYAVVTRQIPPLASYGIAALLAVFVVAHLARHTGTSVPLSLAIPTALAGVMVTAIRLPIVFGLITIVPSMIGWAIQLARITRHGRPPGLSMSTMLLYVVCLAIWLIYAILRDDVAIGTSCVPLIVVMSATVIVSVRAPAVPAVGGAATAPPRLVLLGTGPIQTVMGGDHSDADATSEAAASDEAER